MRSHSLVEPTDVRPGAVLNNPVDRIASPRLLQGKRKSSVLKLTAGSKNTLQKKDIPSTRMSKLTVMEVPRTHSVLLTV